MTGAAEVPVPKATHVTDEEAEAVVEFAADVMGALRLSQWTILIMEEPSEEGTFAEIETVDGKHVAQLYLCENWMDRPDEHRMNTIVHEVCHLMHARVNDAVGDAIDHMHGHEFAPFMKRYHRETELMVDHLAFFICETRTIREAWDKAHGR